MVAGDVLVATKVDRLGRRASDVLATVEGLGKRGIDVVVVQLGSVSLTSPMGKMLLALLSACAEFERDLISERTKAGLARARAEGVVLGKPAPDGSIERVRELLAAGSSITDAAADVGVSRQAIYNWRKAGLLR
jgi:putative DNA-invertase from lambdoid prophage Rac